MAGIAALVVALAGTPARADGPSPPGAGSSLSQALAATDVAWLNDQRAQAGLPTLQVVAWAQGLAEQHSLDMAAARGIFHNTAPLVAAAENAGGVSRYGENVGLGGDLRITQQALLNSPPHRENILDSRFDQVGVGVATDAWGLVYVTEDFAEVAGRPDAGSQASSPAPPTRFTAATPAETAQVGPAAGVTHAASGGSAPDSSLVPGPARKVAPGPAVGAVAPAPRVAVPPRVAPRLAPATAAPQTVLSVAGLPDLAEPLPGVAPASIPSDASLPRAVGARVPVSPSTPEGGAVELALLTVALVLVSRRSRLRGGRHSCRA